MATREPITPDEQTMVARFVATKKAEREAKRIDANHRFPEDFDGPRTVLVNGVPTPHVQEAYIGEHGWVIVQVCDALGHARLDESRLNVVTERREGRVEVVDADDHH